MNNQEFDIDVLIAKCFADEASMEEKKFLEEWENRSEENKKYVLEGKKLLLISGMAEFVNPEKAWHQFNKKLSKGRIEHLPVIRSSRNYRYVSAAAAILLIVIVSAGLIYFYKNPAASKSAFIAASNESLKDTLPDGSSVFLNKGSELRYVENSEKHFREIHLKGEGFFKVLHNSEMPFVIYVHGVNVQDIGTSFNVKENKDGAVVYVQEGIVQLYTDSLQGITLREGETGRFSVKLNSFIKETTNKCNNAIAYMTHKFEFNETDLSEVIAELNEVYHTNIILGNDSLGTCTITVRFVEENIDTMLDVIAETLNLNINKKNGEMILDGEKCK